MKSLTHYNPSGERGDSRWPWLAGWAPILVITLMTWLVAVEPMWAAGVDFIVDEKVQPQPAVVRALPGGIGRTLVAVRNPNGAIEQFIADEVILRPRSEDDLVAFLRRYDGKLLRDGSLPPAPEGTPSGQMRALPASPYRLVQVNLDRVDTSTLINDATVLGVQGQFAFSSKDGLKLAALMLRSKREGIYISPELIFQSHLQEHPDGIGGFLDPDVGCNPGFPEVCDSTVQATKVNWAWEYVRLLDIIPQNNFLAIIDDGFLVAPNGAPLYGNVDLPNTIFRWNFTTETADVSGTSFQCNLSAKVPAPKCWHGTAVANVATAGANNSYGTAGTGSPLTSPFLFKFSGSYFEAAEAIRTAVSWGAQVVNTSFGGTCDFWCDFSGDTSGEGPLFDAVHDAWQSRVVVVASAGNSTTDLDTVYDIPCEVTYVICVGAMGAGANALNAATSADWPSGSNFGFSVDIWAPGTNLRVAPFPNFMNGGWVTNNGSGFGALGVFSGASAAAPFVAGVVGMMKSISPLLRVETVRQILLDTANHSSSDPKLVLHGSIDAFAAVYQAAGKSPVGWINSPSRLTNWWGSVPLSVTFCRGCATDLSNLSSIQYRGRFDKGQGWQDYSIGQSSSSPFSFAWNLTGLTRQPGGMVYAKFVPIAGSLNQDIMSRVVDGLGLNVDNTAPQGQITSPPANSVYANSVPLSAQVSDSESGIDRVEFRVLTTNGWQAVAPAGTAANNFTVNWNTTALSSQTVTIAARAFDVQGNSAELAQIAGVHIDHAAPTITMLYPSADSTAPSWITTNNLTARVLASDANGVAEVRFYAWYRESNGSYSRHTIGTARAPNANGEYTLFWNTSTVPDQADRSWPFELYVEAKGVDTAGNVNSTGVPGWIVGFDRTLPTVQITSPAGPTTYVNGGSVALAVQAGDNLGINGNVTRLNVTARYRDPNAAAPTDHSLAALTNAASWSGSLNVATLPEQSLSITLEAFDEAGQRNFIGKNITIDRTPPTVSGLSVSPNPFVTNGSRFMSFSYTGSEYAPRVDIVINDWQPKFVKRLTYTNVNTDPHVASWDGRDSLGALVPSGSYSYLIQITDQAGNIGTVNGSNFSVVTDTTPPTVSVVVLPNPFSIAVNGFTNIRYTVNEAVRAEIEVLNSANQVVRYLGAQQVSGPISNVIWDGRNATGSLVPAPAAYTARVRATDTAGNVTTTTAAVSVQP